MIRRLIPITVIACVATAGAAWARDMPKSVAPGSPDEKALVKVSESQEPFDDKAIAKVAVTQKWAPVLGQKDQEQLVAAVAVFDYENSKCWVWNRVEYRRAKGGTRVEQFKVSREDADIFEVPCESLDYKPQPRPASARKGVILIPGVRNEDPEDYRVVLECGSQEPFWTTLIHESTFTVTNMQWGDRTCLMKVEGVGSAKLENGMNCVIRGRSLQCE